MSATTTDQIGVKVSVKNIKTNEMLEYKSKTDAANAIGVSRTAVNKVIKSGKVLKNLYVITEQ